MRLLKSSDRFGVYSSYPIELKLGRMILIISPHNRSASNFSIPSGGAVGLRLFKSSSAFTTDNFYPIELNLGRMVLDISPHNHSASDFSISLRGRYGAPPLEIFKSIHSLQFVPDSAETRYYDARQQSAQSPGAVFFISF